MLLAPFIWSVPLWLAVNVIVLVTGLLAAVRTEVALTPKSVAVVLWITALFPGLGEALQNGAVTPVLAGILGLTYAGAGGLAAAAGAVKVFPGVWAIWDVREGRWRALAIGLGIVAIAVIASVLLAGVDVWREYLTMLGNAQSSCVGLTTLRCLGAPTMVAYTLAGVAGLATLVAPRLVGLGLLTLTVWLAAPDFGQHYFLFALPILFVCGARLGRHLGDRDLAKVAAKSAV